APRRRRRALGPASARSRRPGGDRRRAVPDQRDLPALPRRRPGRGPRDHPRGRRRGRHRGGPRAARRGGLRSLLQRQRDPHGAARQAAAGGLHAAPRHVLRGRQRGAHAGSQDQGGRDLRPHHPRGTLAERGGRAGRRLAGPRRLRAHGPRAALPAPGPRARTAGRAQDARGIPVPGDLQADRRRRPARPDRQAARRLRAELRLGADAAGQAAQPDPLRRAHHRLDGRARGRAGQGASPDRRGHPQPPARRHGARHRRDHPLRDRQLGAPHPRLRARGRRPLQHAAAPGPAAHADRQSGTGLDEGGRQPRRRALPLLRGQAGHLRGARLLVDRRRLPARQRALQRRARRGRRAVADHLL
ncbi:MAG: FIG004453: protein YceG like, partial [uncultured Solirubrobacteraceae bacterium]